MSAQVASFFDEATSTFSHVVHAGPGAACAVIDPVLGFDPASGRTDTRGADSILRYIAQQQLTVEWLLETHAHADHLSAAAYLRASVGGRIAASEQIRQVQKVFSGLYNLPVGYCDKAGQFDYLFKADEAFFIGALPARALHVPGHTPADTAFLVDDDCLFVGDTLFAPDVGTARCDFPGGDAARLYRSIKRLLAFPAKTRVYLCHDYPTADRGPMAQTTVAAQRMANIHVRDGIQEAEFVSLRCCRDAQLNMPALLLPAIQVNIRAGVLPEPEENQVRYLKIPLDAL